jgi:PAS domain S-box-containing protein
MRPARQPLRERLVWSTLGLMSADPREHRGAMARGAVYLYAAGSALAFVSVALPGAEGRHLPGLVAVAATALVLSGVHLLAFDRLPYWGFQVSGACSTALVSAGVFLGGESGSAYPLFYLWVVLYAFFFYSFPAASLQLGGVAAAYVALLVHGETGLGPTHAVVTLGTLAMAGTCVLLLKHRLVGLIAGLSASEDRFRTLVERLSLVTYVRGLEVLESNAYASPQVEALLGYTQEEWESDPGLLERIIHPDDRERALAAAARVRETGEPLRLEYRFVARDGRVVWVYDETYLVHDEQGRPCGVQGFLLDITERKQAEEAARESEMLFRAMVKNVPGAIFRCAYDADWTMEFVSDAIEEITGYPASDFIGNRVRPFASVIHPEDNDSLTEAIGALRPYEVQYRIVRADGEVRWVFERGLGQRGPDGDIRIDGAIFDITDRLRAEEKARKAEERNGLMIEQLPLVTYTDALGDDSCCLFISPQIEKILGYGVEEWLADPDFFARLLHPEDRDRILAEAARTNESGETFSAEYRLIARDGRAVWFQDEDVKVFDDGGRPLYCQGYMLDITEHKQLEEQLRQSQKMEAVGRLAGGIAHDFNNLLMAIGGYGDFALSKLADDHPARSDVAEVKRAAERAASLTGQLLAFSRKQVLQPEMLYLNDVVRDIEDMLRRLIGEHVDLHVELDPELRPVRLDRGRIEQVLLNLVLNARDAMPGGGTVAVTTRQVDVSPARAERVVGLEPGPHALLVVGDTGHGMDAETRSRAFEPFFTTKEQGKGTGLGLATVYGIVTQSGGTVVLDSGPGKGTAVSIYLPAAVETRSVPTTAADNGRPAGSETILLAEDETVVRDLVQEILEQAGYTVLAAPDGREALKLSKTHSGGIDLVVTDVVMPGMSGRELAERLWLSRPDTKVLYISGYTDVDVFDPGVLDPGSAFLQKPFSASDLAQRVRQVLDAPRAANAA